MKLLFWISVFLLIYPYLIYPIILNIINLFFNEKQIEYNLSDVSNVSIIISAFNEENIIEKKLNNILDIKYPNDNIQVLVGCDGCTDNTVNKINEFIVSNKLQNVFLYNFKERRGKISVINDLVKLSSNDILILSDANSMMNTNSLIEITKHFQEYDVGIVAGAKKISIGQTSDTSNEEGLYWKLENYLKIKESNIYSTILADGSIYAIRKDLYPFPNSNIVTDDLFISLSVLENKKKIIYNPNAFIFEDSEEDCKSEYKRKKRIASGCFQLIGRIIKNVFTKFNFLISFMFISHKVLRWFGFLWLILILISNVLLINNIIYKITLILQVAVYFIILLGYLMENKHYKVKYIGFVYYFMITIFAQFHGLILCITHKQTVLWDKNNR